MIRLNDETLLQSLQNDGMMALYYVAGTDAYLLERCIHQIVGAALKGGERDLLKFTPKTLTDGEFAELFYSFSLLGDTRVAIVEDFNVNALPADARSLLEELIPLIPESLIVIFSQYADDRRFAPPNKVLDMVSWQARSAVVSVTAKEGAALKRYVAHLAKLEQSAIDEQAIQALISLCGSDLLLIQNEIKKLAALSNYTEISEKHVEAVGVRSAEIGVYRMLSALERGQINDVMAMLGTLLEDRAEPLAIVAVISTAFVNLYRARLIREQRQSLNDLIQVFSYKKGDRKISIAYDNCMRYSLIKLERVLDIICELEMLLKSSPIPQRTVLEQKIAEICLAVSA